MSQRRDPRFQRERDEAGPGRYDEESRRAEQHEYDDTRAYGNARTGQSGFAQRGFSSEERMGEDDSARRFPGPGARHREGGQGGYPYRREDYGASGGPQRERGYYGSGGSFGYGGGFEHDGQRGYEDGPYRAGGFPGSGNEGFHEASGGFGYDVSGYGRQGLGYPGSNEWRAGTPGGGTHQRGGRGYFNEDANRTTPGRGYFGEDARRGFTQDSGYMQSGGERQGQQHEQHPQRSTPYGSSQSHSDARGHEGGGVRVRGGRERGPYYGRTPQGYTRSDERIREDVCEQLSHGHIDPSELSVRVENGTVILEGFVSSRHDKFHVDELADAALGVKEVENRLRVRREGAQAGSAARGEASSTQPGEKRRDNNTNGVRGS